MTKRIIAVSCAVILLVLVFASCRKKPNMTNINGTEYALVTDAEGNTVMSSDGLLRAYNLDDHGYIITNADGSNSEKLVSVPNDVIVGDQSVSTKEYSLAMPKGWSVTDAGVFTKDKTDGKCTVKMGFADGLDKITFSEYVQNDRSQQQLLAAEVTKNKPDYNVDLKNEDFELDGHQAAASTYKIVDGEGKIIHYAVMIFYSYNDQAYYVNYACVNGEGYDESFDFLAYVKENYDVK